MPYYKIESIIISIMELHLILIGLISTASCILIMLCIIKNDNKSSSLSSEKKSFILLSICVIFFFSLSISNFKSGKFSNMYQNAFNENMIEKGQITDVKYIFYGSNGKCNIQKQVKYPTVNQYFESLNNQKFFSQLVSKNYQYLNQYSQQTISQSFSETIQQLIIFKSQKNEGASYFLSKLAQNLCNFNQNSKKTAVLYVKFKEETIDEKDLFKHMKMNNYEQLKRNVCALNGIQIKKQYLNGIYKEQFIQKNKNKRSKVYLIFDNFQYVLHTKIISEFSKTSANSQTIEHYEKYQLFVDKLFNQLISKCKVNVIMNTQYQNNIQKLYLYWQSLMINAQNSLVKQKGKKFPFEIHNWIGLSEFDIYQIVKLSINNLESTKTREKQFFKTYQDYKKNGLNNYQSLQKLFKTFKMMNSNSQEWKVMKKKSKDEIFQSNIQIKQNVADFFGYQKTFQLVKESTCSKISCLKNKIQLDELFQLQKLNILKVQEGEVFFK